MTPPASPRNSARQDESECEILRQLQATPGIFEAISRCSPAERRNQQRLRDEWGAELVRAALSLCDARLRAAGKLPSANLVWLTRIGLEQSTAWAVAHHKAQRFPEGDSICDLCCGIGVDAAALAGRGHVLAVDRDPAMCLRTEANARIWRTRHPVVVREADVVQESWSGAVLHVDPDRRAAGDRAAGDRGVKRLEQYQPDLSWMQQLTAGGASGAIKLGPAANFMQKFPGCEIELISLDGECREATVWFGELAGKYSFRATVLPASESISVDPLSVQASQARTVAEWMFDPDPAIVRSGMLDAAAEQLGLSRLDPEEEYLTGGESVASAFVTPLAVEAVLPNSIRALKQWLRPHPSAFYEIKCRRIPVDAAAVQRQLPTGSGDPRVILFARVQGKARLVIAHRPR